MPGPWGAIGLGLQPNSYLYPSELLGAVPDISTNEVVLAPGCALPLMRGDWLVDIGGPLILQWAHPTTGIFRVPATGWRGTPQFIQSAGANVRGAKLTRIPLWARSPNASSGTPATRPTFTSSGTAVPPRAA